MEGDIMPRLSRLAREREKERLLFEYYRLLGVKRTLKLVHEMSLLGGGRMSLKTNSSFEWLVRRLKLKAE